VDVSSKLGRGGKKAGLESKPGLRRWMRLSYTPSVRLITSVAF